MYTRGTQAKLPMSATNLSKSLAPRIAMRPQRMTRLVLKAFFFHLVMLLCLPDARPKRVKHTCGGTRFVSKGVQTRTPGCPRCDELLAGAASRSNPARVDPLVKRRETLEEDGWDVRVLPGLDHMSAMHSDVVLPLLYDWLGEIAEEQ